MSTSSRDITWHAGVTRDERATRGATLWFTGYSGSGKSTVAAAVESALVAAGRPAYLLDGDNLRHGLNEDLAFSMDDRSENVRRVGHVAALFADAGVVALAPVISPYRAGRDAVRAVHARRDLPFVEIWVSTTIEECERRDPKGLYGKARRGELTGLTGIDDVYEAPVDPELNVPTHEWSIERSVAEVLAVLEAVAPPPA